MDGSPSMFGAIGRWFRNFFSRKAMAVDRAAEAQFTNSPEGISDAFDVDLNQKVNGYRQMRTAVGRIQSGIERDKVTLKEKEAALVTEKKRLDGAIRLAEQSEGDEKAMADHEAAYGRFQANIETLKTDIAALKASILSGEKNLEGYYRELTKLQDMIEKAPREKSEAVAKFISIRERKELFDMMRGIKTTFERSPVQAVKAKLAEMEGEAVVVEKLAGTDRATVDERYEQAGVSLDAKDSLKAILAARKAERAAATGTAEKLVTDERPKIGG